jgi:hypothetical protein
MRERTVEWPRNLVQIQRRDEQPCVANLSTAAATHEAPKLLLSWTTSPRGLLLECAKRSQLTLGVNDLFHAGGAESADQLVLQVCRADEETQPLHVEASEPGAEASPLETAPEVSLLSGVAEAGQPDVQPSRAEGVQELSDGLGAADRHNGNPLGAKIAATALSQRLQRAFVAEPLDQDDRTRAAGNFRVRSRLLVHATYLGNVDAAPATAGVGRR